MHTMPKPLLKINKKNEKYRNIKCKLLIFNQKSQPDKCGTVIAVFSKNRTINELYRAIKNYFTFDTLLLIKLFHKHTILF